jgi:hypothetical protein
MLAELVAEQRHIRRLLQTVVWGAGAVLLAVLTNTMPSNVALTSFELRTEQIKPAKVDPKIDPKADPKSRSARPAAGKPRSGAAAAPDANPEPIRRRTHIVLVGLAPSLLEVGRWMTALERVPVFAAVRLELMEEKALDGVKLSEFRIAIRIEPEADLRAWDELDTFREGRLPDEFASSISGVDDESMEVKR